MLGAILINIFFIHYVVAQDCKIIVPDLGRPDPLYLNIDNSLRIPFNGEIILQNREQIKISCASSTIFLKIIRYVIKGNLFLLYFSVGFSIILASVHQWSFFNPYK